MPNNHAQLVVYGTNDELILRTVAYNISPSKRGTICILIGPVHAKVLGDHGWTKQDVINFIAQYARVRYLIPLLLEGVAFHSARERTRDGRPKGNAAKS